MCGGQKYRKICRKRSASAVWQCTARRAGKSGKTSACVRKDTFAPLGDFVSIDKTVADDMFSNKLYCFIKYSKLGLKITYVFHGGKIDGFWLGYYDINAR